MIKKKDNSFKINPLHLHLQQVYNLLQVVLFIHFTLLTFSNCYEPKTDCLDIRATNFNVAADKACSNCCNYPTLKLQINYVFGDTTLNFNNLYTLNGVDSFKITAAKMYISDFQWVTTDNLIKKVLDTIQLTGYNQNPFVTNDFVLINKKNGFTFDVGHFSEGGIFKQIRFKVGLNSIANQTNPAKMPATHPLNTNRDTVAMYLDSLQGYIFNKIVLQQTNLPQKNIVLQGAQTPIPIIFNQNFGIRDGFDAIISIKVDYKKLLQGIQFNQTQAVMQSQMIANTPNIFSLE
ncbi:MAG: hypothetical protein RLZZ628_4349 [Bacteroidota bacterium]|jgi:hypothetical protein